MHQKQPPEKTAAAELGGTTIFAGSSGAACVQATSRHREHEEGGEKAVHGIEGRCCETRRIPWRQTDPARAIARSRRPRRCRGAGGWWRGSRRPEDALERAARTRRRRRWPAIAAGGIERDEVDVGVDARRRSAARRRAVAGESLRPAMRVHSKKMRRPVRRGVLAAGGDQLGQGPPAARRDEGGALLLGRAVQADGEAVGPLLLARGAGCRGRRRRC